MRHQSIMKGLTIVVQLFGVSYGQALSSTPCPLLGPSYPAPLSLSTAPAISASSSNLSAAISLGLSGDAKPSELLDSNATSFSVDVYSLHDAEPLFTYHFSAPALSNPASGVSVVNSDTIYRLGSTSKLITVYVYLASVGDVSWNEPIINYVPELAYYAQQHSASEQSDSIDIFDWGSVTVGALAGQLAGIPRDAPTGPAVDAQYTAAGLPPVPSINASYCGDPSFPLLCDRANFFSAFFMTHPVYSPSRSPIYSNAAYTLLGWALENITNKTLQAVFDDTLVKPLGLNSTSYSTPPTNESAIIPPGSVFNEDFRYNTPAGGYFSTINDMRVIGRSILNATLLTRSQTDSWMKPRTFTSNPTQFVGAPWEIYKAPGDDTTYIFTKLGDVPGYSSFIALLPDYDVGFTVLAAGENPTASVNVVSNMVIDTFLPALKSATKSAADSVYTATYVDQSTNSSIKITTIDTEPGLVVQAWILEGVDFLKEAAVLVSGDDTISEPISIHLYPSGLSETTTNGTVEGWRAVYEVLPKTINPGVFNQNCASWAGVDALFYGGVGIDEFAFTLNEDRSRAMSIEPRFLREKYDRALLQ